MTWHIDSETMRRYVDDRLDYARTASLETHVTACTTCQVALRRVVAPVPALRSTHVDTWERLADHVDQPRLTLLERALMRYGVPEHTARVVASSELRSGWWLAGVAVLLAATAVAVVATDAAGVAAFLLLSPVLPVAGVALGYGVGGEPAYEVAVVAPYSSFRRLLVRSTAALAAWLPIAGVLSLALPPGVDPVFWLLPALALTAVTLAGCTFVEPVQAAVGVCVVWLAVNVAALRPVRRRDVQLLLDALPYAQETGQAVLVAVGCLALVLTIVRRARFERITPA